MILKNDDQLVIRAQIKWVWMESKSMCSGKFRQEMSYVRGLEEWRGVFQEKRGWKVFIYLFSPQGNNNKNRLLTNNPIL